MGLFSRHDYADDYAAACAELRKLKETMPDPKNWELMESAEVGHHTLIQVRYPNCKNHDGVKILLFTVPLKELVKQKIIDPHFADEHTNIHNLKYHPMARFAPDQWDWAFQFLKMIGKHG